MKGHGSATAAGNARIRTVINIIPKNGIVYAEITAVKFSGNRTAFIPSSIASIIFDRCIVYFNWRSVISTYINRSTNIIRFIIINLSI